MDGIRAGRWLTGLVLVGCLVGVFAWMGLPGSGGGSGARSVAEASTASGAGASGVSLGSLVVPGMQPLDEGQQAADAQQARHSSSAAYVARIRSRTAFRHLGAARAAQVAREAFPEVVDRPAGGAPKLPAGTKLARYVAPNVAQLDLPGGKHGVMESMQPMAKEASRGHFTPIDLGLTADGGGYTPAVSEVDVQIPKRVADGVQLSETGVSLTPVGAHGEPLQGSEGSVDGSTVLYANTQSDADTVVKPTTDGFEIDVLLRSPESPGALYFHVGMPSGARLERQAGSGSAQVVLDGRQIAGVRVPSAQDAAGTTVPVQMSVAGDSLVLTVDHSSGEYQYPIEVDPYVFDKTVSPPTGGYTNWLFAPLGTSNFTYGYPTDEIFMQTIGSYVRGEYDELVYQANGVADAFYIEGEFSNNTWNNNAETKLEFAKGEHVEGEEVLSGNPLYNRVFKNMCVPPGVHTCGETLAGEGNRVRVKQVAKDSSSEVFYAAVFNAAVDVGQTQAPEVGYNQSSSSLEGGRENVLYGSGGWLGEHSGAFEVRTKDNGLGVSDLKVKDLVSGENWTYNAPILEDNLCSGVWCSQENNETFIYTKEMGNGEDPLELCAEDAAQLQTCVKSVTLKVDNTPPRKITMSGIAEKGAELSATPHQITVEATDGTKPTPSSGIGSIKVAVDGKEIGTPQGSCSPGECTTSGKWTINGETLGAGVHQLEVTATDKAGNQTKTEYTFAIRNAKPVALGPGTVDPATGQFGLTSTDISLAGVGGIARTYLSRQPTAGSEGPFGPQWSTSLGAVAESLTVQPNGSAALANASGGLTTFAYNATKKEFEAPEGDSNLKLEAKEKEAGKGITEYLLIDTAQGTVTRFEQPAGVQSTTPKFMGQFGMWGAGSGEFNGTAELATDSKGNLWVVDRGNARIEELNSNKKFVATFGYGVTNGENKFEVCTSACKAGIPGSGSGQLDEPEGIAVDQKGNLWVTDTANNRVEEFNSKLEYLQQFGGGGAASGQFKFPVGITVDNGKVWVVDSINQRVQEFTEKGEFVAAFGYGVTNGENKFEVCTTTCGAGIQGAGIGQFQFPQGIVADSKGNIWVADSNNSRVEEFNEKNEYVRKFGSEGTGPGQFKWLGEIAADTQNDIWVDDVLNGRVQEFNEKGEYLTQFGSLKVPTGLAVNADGSILVNSSSPQQIQEWGHPTWFPTVAEGPATSSANTYSYQAVMVEGKPVIRPTEELGSKPEGVSCSAEPSKSEKGCRELTFWYAEKTSAGEKESEWGEYNGRLMKVLFTAYNPATKAMEVEKPVVEYAYDKQGRLRAEWDPRISPTLKTIYGYDAEGHVTALTPPRQESWAFTYGGIAGDANGGRLLKVMRAPASTNLWAGSTLSSIPPSMEGSPVVGNTMRASALEKFWGGEPIAFAYQWESCNSEGKSCTPILGATNANYTVAPGDVGHKLVAQVTGTNGGGSISATSSASSLVTEWKPEISEHSLPAGSEPTGMGAQGSVFANSRSNKIGFITEAGEVTEYALPAGSMPEGVAPTMLGINYWFTNYGTSKIGKISITGSITEYELPSGSKPAGITVGPDGNLWFTDYGTSKIGKITTSGTITEYPLPAGSDPRGIAEGPDGNLWFTDYGTSKIGKITTSGTITEYGLPGLSLPYAIAQGPDGKLWYTDFLTNEIGKMTTTGEKVAEYALPTGSTPSAITQGPDGNLWFTDAGTAKVGKITTAGVISEYALPAHSEPMGIGNRGSSLWFTESGTSKIGSINTPKWTTPAQPQPGWTVEYHVPLSGTGLPNLTKEEAAKWGQTKDLPKEGTAVFPPDEPMGWPASDYKRASLTYLDEQGRTVNTASPSGAVATAEYNKTNEVVRTLSPDDRAAALKEAKPAEASELLDTKTEYNLEDTEIVKTLGPQHTVKLKSGAEVLARADKHYYYNEGAPGGETYRLVTKTTDAALEAGKEEDKRTTTIAYGGQSNLGWELRQPTSVTNDSGGLNLTSTTVYQENSKKESTGAVVETQSPKGLGKESPSLVYLSQFGHEGSEEGAFKGSMWDAIDSGGNIWVASSGGGHVQKFGSEGKLLKVYGSEGKGEDQFSGPRGVAINKSSGNVYVVDSGNERIEELNSEGKYVGVFGKEGSAQGQLKNPAGDAVDASGNVWVADSANNRIDEFSATGTFVAAFGWGVNNGKAEFQSCTSSCRVGLSGSGNGEFGNPQGIVVAGTTIYVVDYGNNRVQKLSTSGAYIGQFGSKGTGNGQLEQPEGVTVDAGSGDIYVANYEGDRVEEFSPTGTWVRNVGSYGGGSGQLSGPEGLAVSSSGALWVADDGNHRMEAWELASPAPVFGSTFGNTGSESEKLSNPAGEAVDSHGNLWVASAYGNSVKEFSSSGAFLHSFGSWGPGSGQFEEPVGIVVSQSTGNVYVGDESNNRVDELNEKGEFVKAFGFGVSNGEEKLESCTSGCKAGIAGAGSGQFKEPNGVALDAKGDIWIADNSNSRIEELSSSGAFMDASGFGVSNGEEKFETCTSACKAGIRGSGNGQFNGPTGLAFSGGLVYVADENNSRVEELNEKGEYAGKFGSYGTGVGQFDLTDDIGSDVAGNLYVADVVNDRIEEFTPSGTVLASFGLKGAGNGQIAEPGGVAVSSSGVVYVADSGNNRISEWTPSPRPGNEGAHDTKAIYYSAKGEAGVAACQNHPEWVNLVCQTEPVAQPGVSGAPELPTVTTTYNLWDAPERVEEKFGSTTRTKKETFDGAGRLESSEVLSSPAIDKALPKVTDTYSKETGALIEQSTTTEGKTKTITSAFNNLGQLEKYTDANGGVTKYTYEESGDGRLDAVSYEIGKEKFEQTYAYDPTTGFMTSLYDSGLKKSFAATYDIEGKMLTDTYPDNLTAHYTYNQVGAATGIKYEKNAYCASKCPETWFEDNIVPSIYGETLKQASTLAKESYVYDNAGRLTETQETPTGKGCTARLYAYDEESNRTSLTTRESSTEACPTEGGLVESHSYDSANALIDAGITYETFGNTTKLPAPDAGKYELKSSYYVDNQVAGQEQNEKTLNYTYDPDGRTEETETIVKGKHEPIVVSHYSGPGEALTWTAEEENKKWSRNVPGIDGVLDALQTSTGEMALQLHDLQGNVVAKAGLSETETKLSSTYSSTEFGIPTTSSPPKYAWLGAGGVSSELPSSGTVTQGGASYVPEVARTLQVEGVKPPGVFPNGSDPSSPYISYLSPETIESGYESAVHTVQGWEEAEIQKANEEEAKKLDEEENEPEVTEPWWLLEPPLEIPEIIGESAQPVVPGESIGREARHKPKTPQCVVGRPVHLPGHPSAGCCPNGPLTIEGAPGHDCDIPNPEGGEPYESPGRISCGEGTYPGVGPNGTPGCLVEGEDFTDGW